VHGGAESARAAESGGGGAGNSSSSGYGERGAGGSNVANMGRKVDIDDLIDAKVVAELIGLSHRNGVYTYRTRHQDFPAPIVTHGRCYMWHRGDIRRWIKTRSKR